MSWPFDTPLLSPLVVCCVVFVCVLVLVVFRPCCGVLLFGCFLCPSHRPNLSRPLGGGSAESRLWWSPGGVSLSPFPLPWSGLRSTRDACIVIFVYMFHSGHLADFLFPIGHVSLFLISC